MTPETFLALLALAAGTLFTPGPNNAMLAASGATFGFRRTVPHLLGVAIGFPAMVLIVGLALGGLFQTSTIIQETLRWGGAALLLWIAWKIALSGRVSVGRGSGRPMGFPAAAAFQWINPKAWVMAIAATSQFVTGPAPAFAAAVVALTFLCGGLMSSATWTLAGQAIARFMTSPARRRIFNLSMAGLIVLSVAQLLWH
ncbi:LysE family translocator [Albidovulum sediminicola]|uniref:LysE family translocator n=1 Tax=Albidovulum sediminicola TaxID=2984331 RepID=A0ABT2YWL9_9RHOB|nr:LysE family translocator [Defluviimonas sp. WL0075]MCV2863215.1 LysE family translocator [Defluviimonas sp. WL0075]